MRTINLTIPQTGMDLTPRQLKAVAKFRLYSRSKRDYLVKLLSEITGLRIRRKAEADADGVNYWFRKRKEKPFVLSNWQVLNITRRLEFLADNPGEVKPLARLLGIRHRSPRFYGMKFEEYLEADNAFLAFVSTGKIKYLNALCAVLYRPWWQKWSSKRLMRRGNKFSLVPRYKRHTILLWYRGFKEHARTQCPHFFVKGNPESMEEVNMVEQVREMLRMLNHGDVTKNEAIMQGETWDALYELDSLAKEYNEWKKKQKK